MAQVVQHRLSRLAMRAATEVGAARFAAVVLTPVGEPQAAGLAIPDTYVDNGRFGTVSVINTSTDKVAKTVGSASGDSDPQHAGRLRLT
jgi:YVTN family beta-propeller protein